MRRWINLALASITTIVLAGTGVRAQAPEEFYRGKTVRFIVGSSPGGGYDIYARLIAPYIGKQLNANVVVENQPGAGGFTALNRQFHAEPDGLSFIIINGTPMTLSQLVGRPGVTYDLTKMGALGIVTRAPVMWTIGDQAPFRTPAEARALKRQIVWAGSGLMDGLSDGATMTCEALKLDCKVLIGYPGSNEAALAMTKGEADSMYQTDISAQIYAKSGQTHAISVLGRERSTIYPEAPTIFEQLSLDEEGVWWLDYRAAAVMLGRILVAPPGVAPARLKYLQDAVGRALQDPALIAEGERVGYPVRYGDPARQGELMQNVLVGLSDARKARIMELVMKGQ